MNLKKFKTFLLALSFPVFFLFSKSTFSQTHVDSDQLTEAIKQARLTNPELRYIKNLAERMGVRVWLLGGSASSLAYYVKKDLERKKDKNEGWFKPQKEHFGYDYTKIFFPTQDIDLVIEGGSGEKASRLEEELSRKFPYFQGNSNKSAWEVRPLRESRGPKAPLLEGDVLKQHTDSYSVMMIELTESKDPVVRSIKEWDSRNSSLLEDLLKGEISYYDSKNHKETQRYKEGMNPEIFSVIRYLIKMFQYELKPKKEDLERIKEIINEFSDSKLKTGYAKFWWEMNVRKLFMQNSDLERAWRVLDELGLKEKLINLGGDKEKKGSLAFWFHKEPLKAKNIGEGKGRTAKDLGIEIVSHETRDFKAYEIITRSLKGKPNAFLSRENAEGENAAFGAGLYTMKGLTGAARAGFTIRFHVHPEAREGADFALDGDIVIFRNKAVLRVIPDSFNLNFREFFEFLKRSKKNWDNEKGLLERLKRKLDRELLNGKVSDKDLDYVYKEIVLKSVKKGNPSWEIVLQEWFELDLFLSFRDFFEFLRRSEKNWNLEQGLLEKLRRKINRESLNGKVSDKDLDYVYKEIVLKSIEKKDSSWESVISIWFTLDISIKYLDIDFIKRLIDNMVGGEPHQYMINIIRFILSDDRMIQKYHKEWVKIMEALIGRGYASFIAEYFLSKDFVIQEYHQEWMKLVKYMIKKGYGEYIIKYVLSKDLVIRKYHKEWTKLMKYFINKDYPLNHRVILKRVLLKDLIIQQYPEKWAEWMGILVRKQSYSAAGYVLSKEIVIQQHPEKWMKWMIIVLFPEHRMGTFYYAAEELVLWKKSMMKHPQWAKLIQRLAKLAKQYNDHDLKARIEKLVRNHPQWKEWLQTTKSSEEDMKFKLIEDFLKYKSNEKPQFSKNSCKLLF